MRTWHCCQVETRWRAGFGPRALCLTPVLYGLLFACHLLTVQPAAQVSYLCWNLFVLYSFVLPHSCHSDLVSLLLSYNVCKYFLHHLQHCVNLYFTHWFFYTDRSLAQVVVSLVLVSPALNEVPGIQKALSKWIEMWISISE